MKKQIVTVLCFFMACMAWAQDLTVATYNIRNENRGDYKRGDGWTVRAPYLCDQLGFENPDLFGMQECLKRQIDYIVKRLPQYAYIGVDRDDRTVVGNNTPVI